PERILVEGRTAWRVVRARELSFIVDAAAYFEAVAEAFERAEQSILIVGWDVHSRAVLRRRGAEDVELGALLDRCARRRPELRVHVLVWDYAFLFALERELLATVQL